jgi:hypothetical protein
LTLRLELPPEGVPDREVQIDASVRQSLPGSELCSSLTVVVERFTAPRATVLASLNHVILGVAKVADKNVSSLGIAVHLRCGATNVLCGYVVHNRTCAAYIANPVFKRNVRSGTASINPVLHQSPVYDCLTVSLVVITDRDVNITATRVPIAARCVYVEGENILVSTDGVIVGVPRISIAPIRHSWCGHNGAKAQKSHAQSTHFEVQSAIHRSAFRSLN